MHQAILTKSAVLPRAPDLAGRWSCQAKIALGSSTLAFLLLGTIPALTILSASFGMYMVLLGPLGMLSFLNLASKRGILVKDDQVERAEPKANKINRCINE